MQYLIHSIIGGEKGISKIIFDYADPESFIVDLETDYYDPPHYTLYHVNLSNQFSEVEWMTSFTSINWETFLEKYDRSLNPDASPFNFYYGDMRCVATMNISRDFVSLSTSVYGNGDTNSMGCRVKIPKRYFRDVLVKIIKLVSDLELETANINNENM